MYKSVGLVLIVTLLLGFSVYADCTPKAAFMDRLSDTCKASDGICNDAETPADSDCSPNSNSITCQGQRCIFTEIWFAKLLLILIAIGLFFSEKDHGLFIIFAVIMLLINFNPLGILNSPTTVGTNATQSPYLESSFYQYGGAIMPSNPMLGLAIILLGIYLAYKLLKGNNYEPRRKR